MAIQFHIIIQSFVQLFLVALTFIAFKSIVVPSKKEGRESIAAIAPDEIK
jgi:hypothetical protein